jgi:hypothetical protein
MLMKFKAGSDEVDERLSDSSLHQPNASAAQLCIGLRKLNKRLARHGSLTTRAG